ncbi:uncharacterized protein TNCV_4068761 [Trichonephila clavipes]|nr:uncharacterized protein TNCV_4068761 [Trichonephila clavipes]
MVEMIPKRYNTRYFNKHLRIAKESLTSLENGTRNVPPSHIEVYLGLEVERPGLRGSFLISGLKESILFEDEDMPFIEGDDELLGECTQAFLEASQECKDLLSQLGNGLEVDAAAPSRLDFWTPLETDGNCNLDSAFRIIERCRRPNKKFNSEEVIFQVLLDPDCWLNNGSATIGQTSDAIRTLFETLLRRVTSSLEPTDLIRAIIFSEHLDRPISTHLMLVSEMSVEKIMACATKVLQSKSEVRLDEGFNIEMITIRRPVGSGNKRNRRVLIPSIDRLRKKSIRCVPKDDLNICCAKAIILAIAEVEKDVDLRSLRKKDCCLLQRCAIALHQKTGVPQGPCGFEKNCFVRTILKNTSYCCFHYGFKSGFYGSNFFCEECFKPFDHIENHHCTTICHVCRSPSCQIGESKRCSDCDRNTRSDFCFKAHKENGLCDKLYQCRKCCKVILRKVCSKSQHRCEEKRCPSCKKTVSESHMCYLQKEPAKKCNEKLIFFDFETDQTTGEHVVNFAVAQYLDGTEFVCEGYDAIDKFCKYLFSPQHKGFTAIAHNMKGFDGQFILRWMLEQGQCPRVIPNGSKIMSDVDILRRCCKIFREQFQSVTGVDPFTYVTIASACMAVYRSGHIKPKTIAMIPVQGYCNSINFSRDSIRWLDFVAHTEGHRILHALNGTGEPKIAGYSVDGFCKETNTVYQYQGCFHHGCEICYDGDLIHPLTGTTMRSLRQKKEGVIDTLRQRGYNIIQMLEHDFVHLKKTENFQEFHLQHEVTDRLKSRDAFFGGRTNGIQLFYEGCAKYIDFTSLYPWVNKYCEYPVGHPEIITKDFRDIDSYFGLVKCKVFPPKKLFHPVLPFRCNGKLMFPLCRTCAETLNQKTCSHTEEERSITGTWVTEEVKKAREKGYKIVKIYEVYHFQSSSNDLFRSYIDLFLKIKQEASGYPKGCLTDHQKSEYIISYSEKENISLDKNSINVNLGRRSVAKLALNSFWGRWGMNLNKNKLTFVSTVHDFNKMLMDKTKDIKDVFLPTPEIAAFQWTQSNDFVTQDSSTNIFIAAFTTCHARLKLYREFTDELNGGTITSFVTGGPKNYAYKLSDGSEVCKIRGFTLNFQNSLVLNYESVKELVSSMDASRFMTITNPRKITRDKKKRKVENKIESKTYKMVYDKRVIKMILVLYLMATSKWCMYICCCF